MGRNLILAVTAMLALMPMTGFAKTPAASNPLALDVTCDSTFYQGINNLDQIISENPNRLDLYLGKMDAMLSKKNYEAVFVTANQMIEVSKKNNNAWLDFNGSPMGENGFQGLKTVTNRISTLIERGQNGYAVALINKLVTSYPQESYFKMYMADYLYENKKENDAYTIYTSIISDYVSDLAFVDKMANLYAAHLDINKMNEMCNILEASGNLAYVERAKKLRYDHETVDVNFDAIEAFAKKNPKAIAELTDRFKAGDPDLTLEELSIIYFGHATTKRGCTPLWAENNAAQALYEEGKYDECLAICEKALERHPISLAANAFAYKALRQIQGPNSSKVANYKLRCEQLAHMVDCSGGNAAHQTYKILWQEDEDVFVEFFLAENFRTNSDFTNPIFFAVNGK